MNVAPNPFSDPPQQRTPWEYILPFVIITGVIVAVFLGVPSKAHPYEASYYTVQSCHREGTSGIMANRRALNDEALTCAMWNLPFGTRVRVVNLRNNKSVVVTVTDRGPAKRLVKKGRIIDLSKAAFQRIAKLSDGVIRNIRVEVLS